MFSEILAALCERRLLKRRLKQIKSETLPFKKVAPVIQTFGEAFDRSRPVILSLAQHFLPTAESEFGMHQLITIRFLLDRITSTPVNILRLVLQDPVLANADAAALHRSAFEACVNFLYLIQTDTRSRFQSFYVMAFQSERRMYNELQRWEDHSDENIAIYARHQRSIADPPTEAARDVLLRQLGICDEGDVARFPSIQQRCHAIDPVWDFFYDAKYRGLSAWQHGDTTRANLASSLTIHLPEMSDRPVFESLIIVIWTWEIIYELIRAMAVFAGQERIAEIEQINAVCHHVAATSMQQAVVKYHSSPTESATSVVV